MRIKRLGLCAIAALLIVLFAIFSVQKKHTVTLSADEGTIKKSEKPGSIRAFSVGGRR